MTTEDRYSVAVWENSALVNRRAIHDPFVHTTIRPRGLRVLLGVLLGRYEVRVVVNADTETVERVLELDPDYRGAYGSERRKAMDAQFEVALNSFANGPVDDEGDEAPTHDRH